MDAILDTRLKQVCLSDDWQQAELGSRSDGRGICSSLAPEAAIERNVLEGGRDDLSHDTIDLGRRLAYLEPQQATVKFPHPHLAPPSSALPSDQATWHRAPEQRRRCADRA
jgi:hypothetical protein